jgi:hypothetical protein
MNARRVRMWEQNRKCHWCGIDTVLSLAGKRTATIDHLYPRYHPERRYRHGEVVLACSGCNQRRDRDDHWSFTLEERRAIAVRKCHDRALTMDKPPILVWRA